MRPLINDVSALQSCHNLMELSITSSSYFECELSNVSALHSCPNLTKLNLGTCGMVVNLAQLVSCSALSTVNISSTGVIDLCPLAPCLTTLDISWLREVPLHQLAKFMALSSLEMRCINDVNIHLVATCSALTCLNMGQCTFQGDFSPLKGCVRLTSVDLRGCDDIDDVSSLASSCSALSIVDLRDCPLVSDIMSFEACCHLERLLINYHGTNGQHVEAQMLSLHLPCPRFLIEETVLRS